MPTSHDDCFDRTRRLIGQDGLDRLSRAHVIVAGLGGVGAHATESLVRAGVGRLTLIDCDRLAPSNLNRQLLATQDSLGRLKTDVMAERVDRIGLCRRCDPIAERLTPENIPALLDALTPANALIDAIDQLPAKCALILEADRRRVPVFSSMGAGRRWDPAAVRLGDLSETTHCPLARQIRRRLKEAGFSGKLVTAFSTESPLAPDAPSPIIGSVSYLPAIFGHLLAGAAVRHILEALGSASRSAPDDASSQQPPP